MKELYWCYCLASTVAVVSVLPYLHIVYAPCQSLTTEFLAVEAFKLIFIQIEFNTAAIQILNDRRAFAKEVADPDLKLPGSGSEPQEKCGLRSDRQWNLDPDSAPRNLDPAWILLLKYFVLQFVEQSLNILYNLSSFFTTFVQVSW